MLALEHDVFVRFVGDDPEVVRPRDVGNLLEIRACEHAAGRIARRVDVEDFRLRRDLPAELVEVPLPSERLAQRTRHRNSARREDVARDRRPLGVGNDHLVARLEQRLTDDVQGMDPAVCDEHVLDVVDRNVVLVPQLGGNQLAETRNAGRLHVMGLVLGDGASHRGLDSLR